ncbi:MAG: amphi-Trp domain-containing protein [Actinobacteria bacterium]|nr:amphi-Trp domain-containing protein [Actinomycetota bacterium]
MANKIEIEQAYSKQDFARILRELADALESSHSFALYIKNQVVSIPPDGLMKIEYEATESKNEIELELTWKPAA